MKEVRIDTSCGGKAGSSVETYGSYSAEKAVDGDGSSTWYVKKYSRPFWWYYQFPQSKIISRVEIDFFFSPNEVEIVAASECQQGWNAATETTETIFPKTIVSENRLNIPVTPQIVSCIGVVFYHEEKYTGITEIRFYEGDNRQEQ